MSASDGFHSKKTLIINTFNQSAPTCNYLSRSVSNDECVGTAA
jgi:hypothetical protein